MLTGAMNRVNIDQNSTGYYETYLYPPAGTVAHSWDRGVIYNGGSDAGTYIDAANNRLVIRVNLNGHYRAAYCLYAKVPATQTVTKTVTFTSTVNKFEGLKQLGTFDAAPSPNRGGTLSGFSYSVSDNNANVSTYIDGNRVMGQTTY